MLPYKTYLGNFTELHLHHGQQKHIKVYRGIRYNLYKQFWWTNNWTNHSWTENGANIEVPATNEHETINVYFHMNLRCSPIMKNVYLSTRQKGQGGRGVLLAFWVPPLYFPHWHFPLKNAHTLIPSSFSVPTYAHILVLWICVNTFQKVKCTDIDHMVRLKEKCQKLGRLVRKEWMTWRKKFIEYSAKCMPYVNDSDEEDCM